MIRALRNNNPGSLNAGSPWLGLMPRSDMTPEQAAETRFAVFKDPHYGFRALAVTLLNYQRVHYLDTIEGIITRWAPVTENDTDAYVAAVSRACGVGPTDKLVLTNCMLLCRLAKAIAAHEAGGWMFLNADLLSGVSSALGIGGPPLVA